MKRILLFLLMMGLWTFQVQGQTNNCPTVDNVNQIFCESQGEGNNYYRPAVQHLEVIDNGDGVLWYDTASSTESLSLNEFLVDGEDYYAENSSGTCEERVMVTVTLNNSPSAGSTTFHTVSVNDEPFDLVDVFENSVLGPAEAGGTVTPTLTSGTTIFDPAVDPGGQYRYFVPSSNEFCPGDRAFMYITVEADGEDVPIEDVPETNCPIVEQTEQVFCESQGSGNNFYLPSVAHLAASANGDDIAWYDTASSTEPLSQDEILVDAEDYYAGNSSGTCAERTRVIVVINASPSAGSTTFVTFCSTAGELDLLDYLNPSIIGEADPGGTVVPALASGTTIFDPAMDVAGTYEYHVQSPNEFCPADKATIFISLSDFATAGDDVNVQVTEDGGPIDLSTYLTGTPGATLSWQPALASGTNMFDPSVDEAGLYQVTVSNDEGCEDDTAEVNVIIKPSDVPTNCPIVEQSTQSFCQSEGTGNDFYRPSVADLAALPDGDDVVWYDTADATEALSFEELLVDGEDYFAGDASGTCTSRAVVTVELRDTPNAGATTFITVNTTDAPFDLVDILEESILGPAEPGGSLEPALNSGTTWFDPSVDVGGKYTYTVQSSTSCPDDLAVCYITVNDMGDVSAVIQNVDMNVSMYPNPSAGEVNLSVSEGIKPISIRIFDLNGNTVKSMKLNSQSELQNIDLSFLKPSLYFAEIQTDKGKVVKRILKN